MQAVPEMFMVFILKGKQYKATLDDVIAAETLGDDFAVNDCIKLDSGPPLPHLPPDFPS